MPMSLPSGRFEVRNRMGKTSGCTLNCIGGKCCTTGGNCGTTRGSCYRGNDHDPNLDAVENARMAFAGTDVGLRGTADDGIHCGRGLGANCYASCHKTRTVNTHIVPSHLRCQIMLLQQQQLRLEKHCGTYPTPIEVLACRQLVRKYQSGERATAGLFHSHGHYNMHCTCQRLIETEITSKKKGCTTISAFYS